MQIKVDKSEILKYIIENLVDKNLLQNINKIIDETIKELKINTTGNKINLSDAERLVKFIQESDKFKAAVNDCVKQEESSGKSSGGFWFGVAVTGALAYGGYEMFLERYSVEEEYAFISVCVGEQGSKERKKTCINYLKKCLKDDKDFKDCSIPYGVNYLGRY